MRERNKHSFVKKTTIVGIFGTGMPRNEWFSDIFGTLIDWNKRCLGIKFSSKRWQHEGKATFYLSFVLLFCSFAVAIKRYSLFFLIQLLLFLLIHSGTFWYNRSLIPVMSTVKWPWKQQGQISRSSSSKPLNESMLANVSHSYTCHSIFICFKTRLKMCWN